MTHPLRRRARRRLAALFVPLLAALLAAPGALAQTPIPFGSEFRVNTTTHSIQANPSVAVLADGSFVVVWSGYGSESNGVHMRRYSASGSPIGEESFVVNGGEPAVAALADGGFVVTWQNVYYRVYGQRYDASGAPAGARFQVNVSGYYDLLRPSVAGLAGGGFVVTVQKYDYFDDPWYSRYLGVGGQRFDASGAAVGAEFQINTTNRYQPFPSVATVAALAGGGFVVIYKDTRTGSWGGSGWGVFGQRFDASGAAVGAEFQVNTTTGFNPGNPSVAALASGGFVVTWQSQGWNGGVVYGQRYDASGAAVAAKFLVNTYAAADESNPAVTGLADGGFVVAWVGSGSEDDSGVYGQRYDASGTRAGLQFRANTYTNSYQGNPSVTGLTGGGFVATWQSNGQDGSLYGVYGQRFGTGLPLTFQVDGQYLALGPDEVLGLRGDTAPLSWDQSLVLSDDDGDGVWTGTVSFDASLAGGRLEYKFVRHTPAQANLPAGDLGILGGFEGNVGPGDYANRVLEPVPAEATTLPVVTYDNFVSVVCDLPRIDDQVFDGQARTVTITFADADGLAAVAFTDPAGNDYLNNLVVTASAGFTSSDGIRWTAPAPAPEEAVFVLSQDDPSIPTASYFAVLTDACQSPAPQVTVIDPVFEMGTVPGAFALGASYPNPLRAGAGAAVVPFEVPEASTVRVVAYDVLGREVAVLVDGQVEAGRHEARLDGSGLAPGTYVVRMTAGDFAETRRLTIVR